MKGARIYFVLATIVAAALALFFLHSARNRPLEITFVAFTNVYQYDERVTLFVTTNKNTHPVRYRMIIEGKTDGKWGPLAGNSRPTYTAPAGGIIFLWTLPPTGAKPWRISLSYSFEEVPRQRPYPPGLASSSINVDVNHTSTGNLRYRLAEWFYIHNWRGPEFHVAVGPEMFRESTNTPVK